MRALTLRATVLALLAITLACHAQQCVIMHDHLFDDPQRVHEMQACMQFSGSSCCSNEYAESVLHGWDPISTQLQISTDDGPCAELLSDLSCIACSPSQQQWIDQHSYGYTINVCGSFCTELMNSCLDAELLGSQFQNDSFVFPKVGEYFGEGKLTPSEFCDALFGEDSEFQIIYRSHSDDCWDDTRECAQEDFFEMYSECDTSTHTRTFSYILKPNVRCKGGYHPPPPAHHLACAVACQEGYFLPRGDVRCRACQPGSISLGGGERIIVWDRWDNLDLPFVTYCLNGNARYEGDDPCGWVLDGEHTTSGALNDSMSAVLEVAVVMVREGQVRFSFSVDAEPTFDGLTFLIDREVKMKLVSNQINWRSEVYSLGVGFHTLSWVYSKDITLSTGLDMASIRLIEVDGIRYADETCDICSAGQYNPRTASRWCLDCPANTYSDKSGAAECVPCPENQYSYQGATRCTLRAPCDEGDQSFLYTPCKREDGNIFREKVWSWNEPRICNIETGIPLHATEQVPCTPCNPGSYRPIGEPDCMFCPSGTYSHEGATSCTVCPAGTETHKALSLNYFHTWSSGLSTNCTFNCGTPGWRLRETEIDSGSGHGHYSDSTLYLEQTIAEEDAFIEFTFRLDCDERCQLTYTDNNGTSHRYFGGSFFDSDEEETARFSVKKGDRVFQWIFVKTDPHELSRLDRAVITSIQIRGTSIGGATECTSCPAGSYSVDGLQCHLSPAGHYSPAGSSTFFPCADGTFTPEPGQGECLQCGAFTSATADHLGCITDCTFRPPGLGVKYDLSPLKLDDRMWGPVYDSNNQAYYINICSQEHRNHTCFDGDGNAIRTYACQITNHLYSQDIGDIMGFAPHPTDPEHGLVIQMTHGDVCPPEYRGAPMVPRTTNLTFICDPSVGIGMLEGASPIEGPRCHYELIWRSVYGCPVCTSHDYASYYTECNDNNERIKEYYWLDNPKKCHGGVSLPPSEALSCDSFNIECPSGQYLEYNNGEGTCKDAPPGSYSIGGGVQFTNWAEWPDTFKNGPGNQGWRMQGDSVRSGIGSTFFFTTQEFKIDGYISFVYKVYSYGGDEKTGLSFFVDEVQSGPLIRGTRFEYMTLSVAVPKGTHVLKWVFTGGAQGSDTVRERGARITTITILNDYAALRPTLCPMGTFSSEPRSTECSPCPKNSKAPTVGSTTCIPCETGTFSLEGSVTCTVAPQCTLDDFQEVWSPCSADGTHRSYEALDPHICHGGYQPPSWPEEPISCPSCRSGYYRAGYDCVRCEHGMVFNGESCVLASPGFAAVPAISFFSVSESQWPLEFTTACSGSCGSQGWRIRGNSADSGFHIGEVDSVLVYSTSFVMPGSIQFSYRIDTEGAVTSNYNGLEFFIDNEQVHIPYHPIGKRSTADEATYTMVSFDVPSGSHTFVFNYHQEPNVIGKASITGILVRGSTQGGSTTVTACAPGTYSSEQGAITCFDCPAGMYSDAEANDVCHNCGENSISDAIGASSCLECGARTNSNADHTQCVTECIFTDESHRSYNLRGLQRLSGPWEIPSRNSMLHLSVCNGTSAGGCIDEDENPRITHSCEARGGEKYDMGRLLSVSFVPKANVNGILIKMTNGETDGCGIPPHVGRETELFLICDMNATTDAGPVETDDSPSQNSCFISLEWRTPFACPLCTNEDYEYQENECISGVKQSSRVRINDHCFGPLVQGRITETSCSTTYKLSLLALIGVVIVFALLMIVIIVVIIHNRRVTNRYELLITESSKNVEMTPVEDSHKD